MMNRDAFQLRLGAGLLALFAGFWFWQTPGKIRGKLSPADIDRYLGAIDAQVPFPAEEKPELLARLRAWAESDDGKPVYMLNLMRYFDRIQAFPGAPDFSGTPEESNTLYETQVQPILLKLGAYPMVGGPTQGKNLMTYEPALDDWSRVLVVRYPSRRAFLSLLADPAYAPWEPYKIMALKVALVPVSGEVVIPELRTVVGGGLLATFLAVGWLRAVWRHQRSSTPA